MNYKYCYVCYIIVVNLSLELVKYSKIENNSYACFIVYCSTYYYTFIAQVSSLFYLVHWHMTLLLRQMKRNCLHCL